MGKANRQRRREKKKRTGSADRSRVHEPRAHRPPFSTSTSTDDPRFLAEGFALLAESIEAASPSFRIDPLVTGLVARWGAGMPEAASLALHAAVTVGWEHGWQPAELVHAYGRKLPAVDRRLLVGVVLADAGAWRSHPDADPSWLGQLDDLDSDAGGGLDVGDRAGVVGAWVASARLDRVDALLRAATLLSVLWRMPVLPPVADPPSAWGKPSTSRRRSSSPAARSGGAAAGVDERMLGRVRALLAKAESTEFAPEAEALTAKAQELAARYSIDHALLSSTSSAGQGSGEEPRRRRFLIHDPYAKGKSHLLAQVADANRCQAVWSKSVGLSTVFGFAADLAVTDLLYTSLVSQCSTAMQAASKDVASPRTFRDSFVLSFSIHIGERLLAATASTVEAAAAEHGDALLPVLARRGERVEADRDEAFPSLRSNRMRITDGRGWAAGRAAAELARLEVGKAVGR